MWWGSQENNFKDNLYMEFMMEYFVGAMVMFFIILLVGVYYNLKMVLNKLVDAVVYLVEREQELEKDENWIKDKTEELHKTYKN